MASKEDETPVSGSAISCFCQQERKHINRKTGDRCDFIIYEDDEGQHYTCEATKFCFRSVMSNNNQVLVWSRPAFCGFAWVRVPVSEILDGSSLGPCTTLPGFFRYGCEFLALKTFKRQSPITVQVVFGGSSPFPSFSVG